MSKALPIVEPPLQVVLVEPQIPPNTGNVARLCAATGCVLHLVEPFGFKITDASLKRAGLDYWKAVTIEFHESLDAFLASLDPAAHVRLLSTRGQRSHTDVAYQPGDYLVFGSETQGLPRPLLDARAADVITIPMRTDSVRSLNLSSAAAIVVYEALRQITGT